MEMGRIEPGILEAKVTAPARPLAEYSVKNREPPPAMRLIAPNMPLPPPPWVLVFKLIESVIQDSSPLSAMTLSPGWRRSSSAGIVVPSTKCSTLPPLSTQDSYDGEC